MRNLLPDLLGWALLLGLSGFGLGKITAESGLFKPFRLFVVDRESFFGPLLSELAICSTCQGMWWSLAGLYPCIRDVGAYGVLSWTVSTAVIYLCARLSR